MVGWNPETWIPRLSYLIFNEGPINIGLAVQGSQNSDLQGTTSVPVHINNVTPTSLPIKENKSCLKPRGQFPAAACNKFINCWDGTAIEQECLGGLVFNPKGFCDYPINVDCNGKPIVTVSPPPVTSSLPYPSTVSSLVPSNTPPLIPITTPKPVDSTYSSSLPSSSTVGISTTPAVFIQPKPTSPSDPHLRKRCLKPRGQFPSASCNKYVNCWDDTVLEQECPEGLLFSLNGYCDFAARVTCGDRSVDQYVSDRPLVTFKPTETEKPIITEKPVTSDKPVVSDCPRSYGTFRNKTKCNSFYTCIDNKIVGSYECPSGYMFNDELSVCDFDFKVDCSKQYFRENQANQQNNPDQTYNQECPEEFGMFRDKINCSIYYSCAYYKIASQYLCPEGFSFNDNIGVCDYSERVDCSQPVKMFRHINVVPTLPAESMQLINGCKPGEVIRLDSLCNSAARCREDKAEIVQCPAGLAYDSALDKCILQHLATC